MASVLDVWYGLKNALIAAMPAYDFLNWQKSIFVDSADIASLQNLARQQQIAISIFDLSMARNSSRYALAYQFGEKQNACAITSTVDNQFLSAGVTSHLTINNSPNLGDGVSALFGAGNQLFGSVAVANPNLDPYVLAATLAAAINENPQVNANVSASASGQVVAIRNISSSTGYKLGSWVGNKGSAKQEAARTNRAIEIALFASTHEMRDTIAPVILNTIGKLQLSGLTLRDETWARILYNHDMPSRSGRFQDLFGWQFVVDAEFGIDPPVELFPVLVPAYNIQYSVGPV